MKVSLIASGSKGNSILITEGETRLLVDAGLSCRELCKRLDSIGVSPDSLDAVLISHEHTDHVRGLGPLVRKLDIPVFLHTETVGIMRDTGKTSAVREFEFGTGFMVGDLEVCPFPVTHDAVAPAGFTFSGVSGKAGVATDLGIATRLVEQQLGGCHTLVLESNHDESMLRDGPYPWALKQRVRSNHGHLSNDVSASLLGKLIWDGLSSVFLAHLSDTNNRPDLALAAARNALDDQNVCEPRLIVGSQSLPSPLVGP